MPALPVFFAKEGAFSAHISLYLWRGANILAGALLLFLAMCYVHGYVEEGEQAIARGKRVIISIPGETVRARSPAAPKKENEAAEQDIQPLIGKAPKIAVVVSGLGLDKEATEAAFSLPSEVTLSFSPYADNVAQWEKQLKGRRNILLDLPLEPMDYLHQDAGNLALVTQLDREENVRRLEAVVNGMRGIAGLLAAPNEKFTASLAAMQPVLQALKRRNMIFLYQARQGNTMLAEDARKHRVKLLETMGVGSGGFEAEGVRGGWAEVEAAAAQKGYAVAVILPYRGLMEELKVWLEQVRGKGFQVVPVEALFAASGAAVQEGKVPAAKTGGGMHE